MRLPITERRFWHCGAHTAKRNTSLVKLIPDFTKIRCFFSVPRSQDRGAWTSEDGRVAFGGQDDMAILPEHCMYRPRELTYGGGRGAFSFG